MPSETQPVRMTNRLRNPMRAKSWITGLWLLLTPTALLLAQPGFFNFSYNGPTTLFVDQDCTSKLQGNVPNPVVTSTVNANIILSIIGKSPKFKSSLKDDEGTFL